MRLFQPALAALLAALAFGRVASAFPVVLNVDAATDGLASPTQALLAGGVIEVGWLAPGTTNAQIQALAAAADFAGIDAVFNQLVTIPFPSADVDFDSLGGQYFESVTVVPDGDSAGLAAYQNATTGAAGKPMYSWVRNSVSLSGTTQMAFVDGVGVFPPAIDPLGSDFAETFAHSDPPAGTVVLFGTVVSVTVGGAIDNSGVGNTPGDGLGANGSNKVLLLATVVVATEASMQFSAGTATVIENAGSVTVTVTRTGRLDNAVSVQFSTANASALAGTDYTSTSGTLNFMANDTSETIVVPIANPAGFQGDRSFAIGLSNPLPGAAAVLGSPVTIAVTIQDDDPAMSGALQLSAAAYSGAENAGPIAVIVRRVGGSDGAVSATLATAAGSATSPADFTAVNQSVNFSAGDAADKTINIALNDDTTFEGSETFTVTLSAATGGATLGAPTSATVTITDNETPPTGGSLSFNAATFSGSENAGSIAIGVSRTGGSTGAISVQFATSDGTAAAPGDYSSTTGTLSWATGESGAKSFTVPVINNSVDAPDKTFNVALSNPTGGATTNVPASAVVTIADDDIAGTFAFATGIATVAETAGQIVLTINRTVGTAGPVDLQVSTVAGPSPAAAVGDFEALSNRVVSFANGQTSATVSIGIADNSVFSGNRNFQATLTSAGGAAVIGANATATVTIAENDTPIPGRFSLSAATYAGTEGTPTVAITVLRTDGSDGPAAVTYTTANGTARAPGDFPVATGQVSFANGETSKDFLLTINDDLLFEPLESFSVRLSNPTNGARLSSRTTAAVTITDNEASYRLESAALATNEGSTLSVRVTRAIPPALAQSVDYRLTSGSAVAGGDFVSTGGTLVFPAGVAEQTLTIPILDDAIPEAAETFRITLVKVNAADPSIGLGTPSVATVTIARSDDPNEQPDLSVSNGSRFVGGGIFNTTGANQSVVRTENSATFTVRVQNAGDVPDFIILKGVAGGSATSGTVKITRGGTDVTRAVLSTTGLSLANIPVRGAVELKVSVSVRSGAQYSGWGVTLTGTSAGASSKVDAVKISVVRR